MDFVEIIIEYLLIFMFLTMGVLLFIGYPILIIGITITAELKIFRFSL